MAQHDYVVILDGDLTIFAKSRREEQLRRNKELDGAELQNQWAKIKKRLQKYPHEPITDNHATIDIIDLCKIINVIFDPKNYSAIEADFFFRFLKNCPKAAHYVTWLLTKKADEKIEVSAVKLAGSKIFTTTGDFFAHQNLAAQHLQALYAQPDHSQPFFNALLSHNGEPINDDLLGLAKNCAGGISALLDFPKQLLRVPLEVGASGPKQKKYGIDDVLMLTEESKAFVGKKELTPTQAGRALRFLLTHYKASFKGENPIYKGLFPAKVKDEIIFNTPIPLSPAARSERRRTAPFSPTSPASDLSRVPPSPSRSPLTTPTRIQAFSTPSKSVDANSPIGRSPRDAKLVKPQALNPLQLQRVEAFREFIFDCSKFPATNTLKDIFKQHPDVFYDFAEHANNEELDKLLSCFPNEQLQDFLEQTRYQTVYSRIIRKRIDQIALHLAERLPTGNRSFRKWFDNFFIAGDYTLRTALQSKFSELANGDNSDKAQLLSMLRSAPVRKQLELHENPELASDLLKTFSQLFLADTNTETPDWAIGFELARDNALWQQLMDKGQGTFRRWFQPWAEQLFQDPLKFKLSEVFPPAFRFFFARYIVEKVGVEDLIIDAVINEKTLADELADWIAFEKKDEFNSLGSKRHWLRRMFTINDKQATLTDQRIRRVNEKILTPLWDNGKQPDYPFIPPKSVKTENPALDVRSVPSSPTSRQKPNSSAERRTTEIAEQLHASPLVSATQALSASATQKPRMLQQSVAAEAKQGPAHEAIQEGNRSRRTSDSDTVTSESSDVDENRLVVVHLEPETAPAQRV